MQLCFRATASGISRDRALIDVLFAEVDELEIEELCEHRNETGLRYESEVHQYATERQAPLPGLVVCLIELLSRYQGAREQ